MKMPHMVPAGSGRLPPLCVGSADECAAIFSRSEPRWVLR